MKMTYVHCYLTDWGSVEVRRLVTLKVWVEFQRGAAQQPNGPEIGSDKKIIKSAKIFFPKFVFPPISKTKFDKSLCFVFVQNLPNFLILIFRSNILKPSDSFKTFSCPMFTPHWIKVGSWEVLSNLYRTIIFLKIPIKYNI